MELFNKKTGAPVKNKDRVVMEGHCRPHARFQGLIFREHKFDGRFAEKPSENYPRGRVRLFIHGEERISWSDPEIWGLEWRDCE